MNYFVTAIDTDSGKTLVSSILCEALAADYWKPVQAGFPRDTEIVQSLVTNSQTRFHPETHLLHTPASPHAASRLDGVQISLNDFRLPPSTRHLVIEGAGGCLVPLNDREFVIDLVSLFSAQVVLVADLYLGSINHTLLTVECLKRRNLPVVGIVFNGDANPESERIILQHSGYRHLISIAREQEIDGHVVKKYSVEMKRALHAKS